LKTCLFCLALLLGFNSANASTFQYIYIEANEGSSSGGHVAIQFEDEVFHYQYTGGMTRLIRDEADSFQFDYRYLQNRTLHVADVEVTESTFNRLHTHFKQQFWDQERQFKRLQGLDNDTLLLEWLQAQKLDTGTIAPKTLNVPGAGLFYTHQTLPNYPGDCNTAAAATSVFDQLQQQVQQEYGHAFLAQLKQQLLQDIHRLTPDQANSSDYGFSQRYLDLLSGLLAVQVIMDKRPLNTDACYQLDAAQWQLDAAKVRLLKGYQQRLLKSAQTLIHKTRPDWGQALLVGLARLLVVEQTLRTGRWTFLDDFSADAISISTKDFSQQSREMSVQREAAESNWRKQWETLGDEALLDDLQYADLERGANRHREWQSSLSTQTLRYQGQQALPDKVLNLPASIDKPDLSELKISQAIENLNRLRPVLAAEMEAQYAYNLISRNCVTEIFRTINQALGDETQKQLGARVDADLNFIPFTAFAYVQTHFPVSNSRVLASFRTQALARQYEREFAPWVYLRESNVLTAELYHYNPDDAAFIFFTDDGFFLRPVYGAFNLLTGLGQSLLGLFEWPLDDGAALHNGTRGLMMSLPELAFVNIRKGSYKFDFRANLPP
jgi:hypothetical protein